MDALTDADIRRGGKLPLNAGPTSSVSSKATSDGVSSLSVPIGNNEKHSWFALRVSYGRIEKATELLRKESIETFVAQHKVSRTYNGKKVYSKESLIPNVFFAHMTSSRAHSLLGETAQRLPSYIRFYRNKLLPRQHDMLHPPLIISDREMKEFIKLTSVESEHVKMVTKDKCRFKTNEKVTITDGAFKGVHGRVARVAGEQRVVVEIANQWIIATAYIPTAFIQNKV